MPGQEEHWGWFLFDLLYTKEKYCYIYRLWWKSQMLCIILGILASFDILKTGFSRFVWVDFLLKSSILTREKKTSNFSHSIYFKVRFAPFTLHKQLSSFRYIDYTKTWNWYFPIYSWASYKNTANVLQASLGTATLCKGKASMELATKQNLPTALNLLILMYVAECTSILVSRHRWKQNCFSKWGPLLV